MAKYIRLLLVEDSEEDEELILLTLRRSGFQPDYKRVETESSFLNALDKKEWDLILCDYNLPDFDGLSALHLLKEKNLNIPFILISGVIGEDKAVDAMKAGANDYLLKDNLQRLVPAIERELEDARMRVRHKKAEGERNRLFKVVQQSFNEIYLFNSQTFCFEYVNEAVLNNLGYSLSQMQSKTPFDINQDLEKNWFENLLQALKNGEKEKIEFFSIHVRKDGTTYPVETHVQLIRQEKDDFFSAISLDITNKKLAEKLAKSNKYKTEFLANISHELRTPLNSIILLSKLLSENRADNLNRNQLEYVNVINQSGNHLLELIDDILDLSKIEAGEMVVNISILDIENTIGNLKKLFQPVAWDKELDFRVENLAGTDRQLKTDRLRVEQILRNFLSNAFKFTSAGEVCLSIYDPDENELEATGLTCEKAVAFQVRDTGIGIPADKQEMIFKAFRQIDGSTRRKYGGTGLGLAICRKLAALLKGKVTLNSRMEEGTVCTLYLPAEEKAPADRVNHTAGKIPNTDPLRQKEPAIQEQTILLVDDSEIHVTALRELLEHDGKTCLTAGSLQEALDIIASKDIQCLVLDLGLPDCSGIPAVKEIKNATESLPVIIYTGKSLSVSEETELKKLAESIVIKTNNSFNQLRKNLDRILAGRQTPLNPTETGQNYKGKKALIVDDDQRNVYSLSSVLNRYGIEVRTACNGNEALYIMQNQVFDIVFMDMMMPVMNGYETIQHIRNNQKWTDLPVISVTAKARNEDRDKCIGAGATEYISKPINLDKLENILEDCFREL